MCLMAKSKFNERLVLCVKARKVRDLVKGLDDKRLKGNIGTEVSDVQPLNISCAFVTLLVSKFGAEDRFKHPANILYVYITLLFL